MTTTIDVIFLSILSPCAVYMLIGIGIMIGERRARNEERRKRLRRGWLGDAKVDAKVKAPRLP